MRGDVRIVIEIDGAAPEVLQALASALGVSTGSAVSQQGAPGDSGDQNAGAAPVSPGGEGSIEATAPTSPYAATVNGALNAGPAPSESALTSGMPSPVTAADAASVMGAAGDISAGTAPTLPEQ